MGRRRGSILGGEALNNSSYWVLLLTILVSAAAFQGIGPVRGGPPHVMDGTVGHTTASPSPMVQGLPDGRPNEWIVPWAGAAARPEGATLLGEGHFLPPQTDFGRDTNGNQLFDLLVVNATINVTVADNYTVDGFLYLSNSSLPLYNGTSIYLSPRDWTISVSYDGSAISGSGVDGPYLVILSLWDGLHQRLDITNHTTQAYRHSDFDGVPAEFTPPHSDAGIDSDGDGRFNLLNVYANLTVNVAGEYYVSALLHDVNETLSLVSSVFVTLNLGRETVVLPFHGSELNASGVDGPYIIEMSLYSTSPSQRLGTDFHLTAAYNHSEFEEPTVMQSSYAPTPPTIDGALAADEWADAHVEDLTAIPGNQVPALLLVMNDDKFLYVAYDAVGDTSPNSTDVAAVAFDTKDDRQRTLNHEDEFVLGGGVSGVRNNQAHYVFTGGFNWSVFDTPFAIPGLAGAWGFGPSPAGGPNHRIYEFRIPLPLLVAVPGGTLGFFGGSHAAPGVFDNATSGVSLWPEWSQVPSPILPYGDLVLATRWDTAPPTIAITSPQPDAVVMDPSITVTWTASDNGSGLARFEVRVDDGAAVVRPLSPMSYTITDLANGPHTINVTAFDRFGNAQSATVRITVDATVPQVTIVAPQGGFLGTGTVAVSWTIADTGSGPAAIELSLDGGPPVRLPGTARSYTFTAVADGPHAIRVTGTDAAGNSASATVTITIDTAAPNVAITFPGEGGVVTSQDVTVSFTKDDASSGIDHLEIRVDRGASVTLGASETSYALTALSPGIHRVEVTAVDRVGNSRTETVTFRVDTSFLSPSGPYGYGGIGVVAALFVGVGVAAVAIVRRRRWARPPPSPP